MTFIDIKLSERDKLQSALCQRSFSRQPVWIHLVRRLRSIASVHACSDVGQDFLEKVEGAERCG